MAPPPVCVPETDTFVPVAQFLAVPDGGVICLDITPPLRDEAPDNRPILVCMHGLTGGSHESVRRKGL